ncbi:Alpha/beta hydrolase fold-1 [Propionibacterium ruminifibrarum]|uniref:Alpha/beta hydrolase fold-1 n=2 Tax=Propionibacterium ruminifibrarum TaxID=1962131 RepID=A0A375I021_9ACTN|nr:Alpha/beta hydrolase fold-1 [Propionibacterium ruminifibrarum]
MMSHPRSRVCSLALACVMALAGCGGATSPTPSPSPPQSSATSSSTPSLPSPSATWDGLGAAPDRQQIDVPQPDVPGFTEAPSGQGLQRYLGQQVDWGECAPLEDADEDEQQEASGDRCATVAAPLDWNDPDGQAITLAMRMRPAPGGASDQYLFINPGGPGGSAQDFVTYVETTGFESYNIVGVDPRGSGESTPVVCGDLEQTDALENADWSPDDQSEVDALVAASRDFAAQCRRNSGALLDHISSIDTAHDMDLVRALLDQDVLNWYGVSYGTWLGAVYAELYPDHVGRMVLDSAVNVTDRDDVKQADGFEQALGAFAQWCADDASCRLGDGRQEVLETIAAFLDDLDAQPLPVDDRLLTQTLALNGILQFLYFDSDAYPYLSQAITQARSGLGRYLLRVSDIMTGRGDDGYDPIAYAFPGIGCADTTDDGEQQAISDWQNDDFPNAPVLGRAMGPELRCPAWAARPGPQIKVTAADAPPILIVSNTGDSATPHEYAQWMRQQMPTTVLVTREAEGHGAFGSGSACLDGAVTAFLDAGTVPQDGLVCTD